MPLFALANAGIAINGGFLAQAFSSPITLGILVGYVVGKPVGILGCSWLVARLSRGRLRPPLGWAAVAGGGTIAGTVDDGRLTFPHPRNRLAARMDRSGRRPPAIGSELHERGPLSVHILEALDGFGQGSAR